MLFLYVHNKISINVTKKNGLKKCQMIYPSKMLVRLDNDYPYCLGIWL